MKLEFDIHQPLEATDFASNQLFGFLSSGRTMDAIRIVRRLTSFLYILMSPTERRGRDAVGKVTC